LALIEAMVLIAVLGILAAIGVPNYSRYSMRASLVKAGAELAEYRTKMERFYQNNRTYAKDGVCGGSVAQRVANFVITCTVAATGDSYTAAATGTGPSAGFVYTINQANVRSTQAIPSHWGQLPGDASQKWVTQ
jgi:type IV pilus assembly protein PilE